MRSESASANGHEQVPRSTSQKTPRSTSRILSVLLPSAGDLVFMLVFFALSYGALAPGMLGDADVGWHIRSGELILASRAVPHTDSFSATKAGQPWFAWEWLYDVLLAVIHARTGLNGVVAFSAFTIALTFFLVFRFALQRDATLPTTVLPLLFCLVASSIHFLARPHVLGWLLTIVWFWILDSSHRFALRTSRADPALGALPPIMILWVNLHGTFVIGLVLLGIYAVADLLTAWRASPGILREGAEVHARVLSAVFILSALCSLLNPYGYRLHVHVYQYLSSSFLMHHIEEFRRPDFHGLPTQFFLLLMALTGVASFAVRGKLRWADWLIIAFSISSGLRAARNLPVASMLLTTLIAPMLARRRTGSESRLRRLGERMTQFNWQLGGHLWPIVMTAITAWVCLNQGHLFGRQLMNARFSERRFPVQAVNFLLQRGNRESVFSLDSYGGYLIYRLYPDVKVFIDDRHDFYGEEYLKAYLKVLHAEPGWENVLDRLKVNLAIFPTKSKIGDAMRAAPSWAATYSDPTATVFERKNGVLN